MCKPKIYLLQPRGRKYDGDTGYRALLIAANSEAHARVMAHARLIWTQ